MVQALDEKFLCAPGNSRRIPEDAEVEVVGGLRVAWLPEDGSMLEIARVNYQDEAGNLISGWIPVSFLI